MAGSLADITELLETARANEQSHLRYHALEMRLLEASSFAALVGELTDGLRETFGTEYATLVLADPDGILAGLLASETAARGIAPGRLVLNADVRRVASRAAHPVLGPYDPLRHAGLFPGVRPPASVAILPLARAGHPFGSINLGSRDGRRYAAGLGTLWMERLAGIAALAIEHCVAAERLRMTTLTDPLTGLYNRRFLKARLDEELAGAARRKAPLGCLFADIDHFKRINDEFDHLAGDAVLRECVERIRAVLRTNDVLARYGGEEFTALLPESDADAAHACAERVRRAVAGAPFTLPGGQRLSLTISLGLAVFDPRRAGSVAGEQLLRAADQAVLAAKRAGRNRVMVG